MGSRNWLGSCRGFSSTTWHMVILGSVPHSEGGKAFQAFGEQAPQQLAPYLWTKDWVGYI